MEKILKNFFNKKANIVAKELLGKVLVRKIGDNLLKSRIVETEAYFGLNDPASRASKGKNKISEIMFEDSGKILVYNVHKYLMFNIVTSQKGNAQAVLIRALEPLNFKARCNGPGLLTQALEISKKEFHGKDILNNNLVWIEENNKDKDFEIIKSFRIGVSKDLNIPLRFYIKDNKFVSKK
ncbi:MAG: DNA-3-methyladenine glycosylase [Nanoarchaeota archaeon]